MHLPSITTQRNSIAQFDDFFRIRKHFLAADIRRGGSVTSRRLPGKQPAEIVRGVQGFRIVRRLPAGSDFAGSSSHASAGGKSHVINNR
jgi:hypothetical protein